MSTLRTHTKEIDGRTLELLTRIKEAVTVKPPIPDEEKTLRKAFARAAAVILQDPSLCTLDALTVFGKVENPALRQDAISALGSVVIQYKSGTALSAVEEALEDKNADVRRMGGVTLRTIVREFPPYAKGIVHTLGNGLKSDYQDVQEDSATGLEVVGVLSADEAETAAAYLNTALYNPDRHNHEVRKKAAHGLAAIGLQHEEQVHFVIQELGHALADPDPFVRFAAIDGLKALGLKYEAQREEVIGVLEDARPGQQSLYVVRNEIDKALSALRPSALPEVLIEDPEAAALRERKAIEAEALKLQERTALEEKTKKLQAVRELADGLEL